ncbi:MAG: PucR family transcriptional regulator ligand-binding domain-containing protein [bacterium]|nr:PucR family transcriptional regulator ligand-binding domain-containing protein [bacterium]
MTIEELLALPSLAGIELLAGKTGIHRRISTVTVVDTPDGATWIKGNEFVITTAFAVKDDNKLITELIYQLHKSNAAGLGIKTGRFIKAIPQEAIKAADLLSFPIISIPEKYAFCDIINPALSLIVNRQSAQLVQAATIHREFLELAVNNNSVPDILQTLQSLLSQSAVFVDIHFRQFYYSDYDSHISRQLQNIGFGEFSPELFPQYTCHAVANKTEKFGYLMIDGEKGKGLDNDTAQTAIEYASVVLILRIQTRISNQHIEEKYRDVFLEDLLINNVKTENEIHNRASLYGWNFRNGGLVAVIDINNIKKYYIKGLDPETNERLEETIQNIFNVSIDNMLRIFPKAKYYKQSDLIVFIISPENYDQNKIYSQLEIIFNNIRERIASKMSFTITMGIGEYFENIKDIHHSYAQARTSINLGYQLEKFDCILFYSRMGIYRLLAATMGTEESEEFNRRYIKPLLDYDAKYHTSLMVTLEAIAKSGWNLKNASASLFIHYNSIKYRFTKICDLLNADLRDHEQRLAVEMALKMRMVNNHRWL